MAFRNNKRKKCEDLEEEEREMWNMVVETFDDQHGVDTDRSPAHLSLAKEGEEEDEISRLFKSGKKKETEKSPQEIAMIVEAFMAELEVAAEEDAELNRQSKPAINKLRKLPLLIDALSKKKVQEELLDHGVMSVLKKWLKPLPDNSLPNMNIRSSILNILADNPIDLDRDDRREQLMESGLGNVIMFLSKSDEETAANRKLAIQLIHNWCRNLYNNRLHIHSGDHCDYERATKKPKAAANTVVRPGSTRQRLQKKLQQLKAMKNKNPIKSHN